MECGIIAALTPVDGVVELLQRERCHRVLWLVDSARVELRVQLLVVGLRLHRGGVHLLVELREHIHPHCPVCRT